MPDLGKYAAEVLGAYASTAILLAALVVLTWRRSARVRRALERAEARRDE
ncbi:heme exporter protein CcmD [Palleronia sediminis]|uniref:Heme exporter protein D n=1 Tax=Palleronia sediminis TaxID=2547833 RepID=A0A4R6AHM0_9RHOB|nr:heme exporter protein CcmD [Palleronia sediminis]TDL83701.1 heme exporter protein CcmD [Palleronia sediminis]